MVNHVEQILAIADGSALETYASAELDRGREFLAKILGDSDAAGTTNTLRPLNELFLNLGNLRRAIGLLSSTHPELSFRESCEKAERELSEFFTSLSLNRDLFDRIAACDSSELADDGKRMHEHLLRDFRRAGVDRDEEVRDEVAKLRQELVELGQVFARNIRTDVRKIYLNSAAELDGLPEDYKREHAPESDGRITITTDYPDYNPFMVYAKSESRREELYRAFRSRAYPANDQVLLDILSRRHRLSQLLGYESWADYASEDKMIQNAASIGKFIDRVAAAADSRSQSEYDLLLERKRQDCADVERVNDWEKGHLEEMYRVENFNVDSRELRPYLNYVSCRDGILRLVERLFGLEFRSAPDAQRWHEEVDVIDVFESDERIGRVYLDMHPRDGKFKHAAMFPLIQGVKSVDGAERIPPAAALVCNFPKPATAGAPALLEHDDVVTFFHEFGHLLHHLLGVDTEWSSLAGTGTEWDFVEVPSQLFEEWAWDTEVLQSFAVNESGEVIPAELVSRLRAARDFGRSLQVRQQMYYACLSLRCHDTRPEDLDLEALQRDLQNQFSRFRFVDGTHFHASFGHLDGYSALYYTYMWSLVIEKDLFSAFKTNGIFDREVSERYRRMVLGPGGSKEAAQLVRDFLGRDYGFAAFEDWLNAGSNYETAAAEGGNAAGI